jgi:ferritin-like metal-binding protein YciE
LNDLLVQQIEDLYDAEQRLVEALPKMEEAATFPELKTAFNTHLKETEMHVGRLEQIFGLLGVEPRRETCDGMKGLISEGKEMIDARGDDWVRDAGLIGAAQRFEHYEIAAYGTCRSLAEQLGFDDVVRICQETLNEESACDKQLTQLAESRAHVMARH